jgi:PPM family protein phosphatase
MSADPVYLDVAGISDVGARKNNEDAFLLADFRANQTFGNHARLVRPCAENSFLLVVSDGVGGGALGEMASQLTVHAINDALSRLSPQIPAPDRLIAAVEQANYIIWHEGRRNPDYKGMSATATAVLIEGDRAFIAEVGDSRAYLLRGGITTQLTTDQSLVEVLLAKGIISAEQAQNHPRKNVILQAIGLNEAIQVAVGQLYLQQHDFLLICSDGLSNNVLGHEMQQMVRVSENLPEACQRLVKLANDRGGKDNITAVLANLQGEGLPVTCQRDINSPIVEMLYVFDPERVAVKSHKRTTLLGNTVPPRLASLPPRTEELRVLDNLYHYPRGEQLNTQYQQLQQLFQQAISVLSEQHNEIAQVEAWVATQHACYARLEDLEGKLASAQQNIEQAWRAVREVVSQFDQTIN